MDVRKILAIVLLGSLIYLSSAIAEPVLPVFTGQWVLDSYMYDIAPVFQYWDNCSFKRYTFPAIAKTNDLSTALSILASHHYKKSCSCNIDQATPLERRPRFFPGDEQDWYRVESLVGSLHDYYINWARCNCSDTKREGCFGYLEPLYQCPNGASVGWDYDTVINHHGCTTIPFCLADVVARDFDAAGMQSIGHVGLVTTDGYFPYALEALNDEQVIHWWGWDSEIGNSFISHKCAHGTAGDYCQYWGDRYNLVPDLTEDQAGKILTIGIEQSRFEPIYNPTISDGPYGHPGSIVAVMVYNQTDQRWKKQNAIDRARFRCDTFVNYTYHTVTGVTLPQYGKDILPYATYLSFPNLRNGTRLDYSMWNQNHFHHIAPSWLFEKDEILELLQQDNTSLVQLDQALSNYVTDQNIERKNKIVFLWEQTINYSNNIDKFIYLTRWLSTLQPVGLTPEFINLYSQLNDIECKASLIGMIHNSMLLIEKQGYGDFLVKNNSNNIVMGQKFLINLLEYENNRKILRDIIFYLPSIFPAEQAGKLIKTVIDHYDQSNSKDSKPLLTENEYYFQQLALAFSSNEEIKQLLLPALLQEIKQLKPSSQKTFNEYLLFFEKRYEEIKHGN